MDPEVVLRGRHVQRVVVGVPDGETHVRARIETAQGDVITLERATLAALARAYVELATHPTRRAVELRARELPDRKEGFAVWQLIEFDGDEAALRRELGSEDADAEIGLESLDFEPARTPDLEESLAFGDVPTRSSRPPRRS
jgi:hypothetical protein